MLSMASNSPMPPPPYSSAIFNPEIPAIGEQLDVLQREISVPRERRIRKFTASQILQ